MAQKTVLDSRDKRIKRIRQKVQGTSERPRLVVFRSNKHIYAQIIDDTKGQTLASASSLELKGGAKTLTVDVAAEVGRLISKKAKQKGIIKVVFDRRGRKYHGRIKALADGARQGNLKF